MPKYNSPSSSAFFKRNNTIQIITNKISQKELKKQKKQNIQFNTNISDDDFNKLMDSENNVIKDHKNNKEILNFYDTIKKNNSIDKIEQINLLLETKLIGEDLYSKIKLNNISGNISCNISGIDLLNGILNKYNDVNLEKYNWINEYGLVLKNLLENNIQNQLICLLIIQNYCMINGLVKLNYKNIQIYQIKLFFQLFFTNEIIEETVYWKWYEMLNDYIDIDDDNKKKILLQTTDFFIILKTTFQDEEDNNCNEINNDDLDEKSDDIELDKKYDDIYDVPEEQDYNLDDLYTLEDLKCRF